MQKVVMVYDIGDDCTWSATNTLCFEYESVLKAKLDFMKVCWEQKKKYEDFVKKNKKLSPKERIANYLKVSSEFEFCSYEFEYSQFIHEITYEQRTPVCRPSITETWPQFFELNDWFEHYKAKI